MANARIIRLGLQLGRILPPKLGYFVADWVAWGLIKRNTSADIAALRKNLRVVLGPDVSAQQLEHTVRSSFRNVARAYYDLYHALALGKEYVRASVEFTEQTQEIIAEYFGKGRGIMAVTSHSGNFDLAGLAYGLLGIPTQVITWPSPPEDYQMQNEIRSWVGFDVTPLDVHALKQAVQTLRQGGIVATAVDRPPPPGSGVYLPFFGRPARLPIGHIRLAMQTNAYLAVAQCHKHPTKPHVYQIHIEPLIEVEEEGDREQTIYTYASRVLALLEKHIRQYPDQWYMFHPVWDDSADEIAATSF
ncbi:MAG: lysophospholipid acyltransferase family protein [Chloroflexi bacterium]|nr:lysophospholipid acyltransferase family protein [Chloroflexota bacterium]